MNKRDLPSVKLAYWPDTDRLLWQRSCRPAGPFDDDGLASQWRPATIRNCEKGYGVWLAWLEITGQLDHEAHPLARVTKAKIDQFLACYRIGRSELTVAGTLRAIAYVLRACSPPDGATWLTRLSHRLVNTASPSRPKLPRMARVADLHALGIRLMAEGKERILGGKTSGAVLYRDGLMIALLICRPLRRINLHGLRLGHSLLLDEHGAKVLLARGETKKRTCYEARIPDDLMPALTTYLDAVRPVLLGRLADSDDDQGRLWIGRGGTPLSELSITVRIGNHCQRHLGRRVSPHLFRDCVATEIALEASEQIGITREILGHKSPLSAAVYNQAASFTAFARHNCVIDDLCREDEA